ncbi:uncharacterized protein LOC102313307 [Haplochromis burtoni]|uniref:uncharacterized protein LOC102313307 n=1 Tax=Haplochromis burtoni TaxID=8153 RepID=UPI001C2CD68D|nr:uncharacterized protein LOC102313307 [Haplochromis burtoni]
MLRRFTTVSGMMKMKLLLVAILMIILPAMEVIGVGPAPPGQPDAWLTTTGRAGLNLNGKMFTLSSNNGGVTFYPPSYHFPTPYQTRRHKDRALMTTAATTRAPTAVSPTTGVSVCLRYMTDYMYQTFPLFTVSPKKSTLKLQGSADIFTLSYQDHNSVGLEPIVYSWPDIKQDIWTSVCLTVDTSKGVVQLFNGAYMSVRKVLPSQYVWAGEPVIDFPGFDGQLTDVHVWDYPLNYKEVFYYITKGYYGSYNGSVISWSYISYSNRGRAVMEDSYDMQAKQPIREAEQERGLKEEKLRFFSVEEEKRQHLF